LHLEGEIRPRGIGTGRLEDDVGRRAQRIRAAGTSAFCLPFMVDTESRAAWKGVHESAHRLNEAGVHLVGAVLINSRSVAGNRIESEKEETGGSEPHANALDELVDDRLIAEPQRQRQQVEAAG